MPDHLFLLTALLQADAPPDTMGYLVLGYAVLWLVGAVYFVTLSSRQRNLKQDLELMQRLLKEEEGEK
ncbi:MAG: hypothetical protein Fur0021_14180 [Candidatus Promineifilaceae bacterium]